MADLLWSDVSGYFEFDGSLLDAYVFNVNIGDWPVVVDVVGAQTWLIEYTSDGSPRPLPSDVGDIFRRRGDAATTLRIWPAAGIMVNTHFFNEDEIEFDFRSSRLSRPRPTRHLCSLLRTIGTVLRKLITVTPETALIGHSSSIPPSAVV